MRNNFIVADNLNTRGHSCKLIKQHCTMDATKFYFSSQYLEFTVRGCSLCSLCESVTAFENRLLQFTVTLWCYVCHMAY